jgi:hypothetical protein
MCPICITNAALVAAGATSGAGVLGVVVVKLRALRRAPRKHKKQGEKHG